MSGRVDPAMIPWNRAAPDLTWEPAQQSNLTHDARQRIADLVETLISLLDHSEPDSEDIPVFPGHPDYLPPSQSWLMNWQGEWSGIDADREADDCDDEPDADDEMDPES